MFVNYQQRLELKVSASLNDGLNESLSIQIQTVQIPMNEC
jgi:hypothetical protein